MSTAARTPRVGDLVMVVTEGPLPFRLTAFDGTDLGPPDSDLVVHVASEEGLRYILSAPGDLGLARAYLTDNLVLRGVHEGDPYEIFRRLKRDLRTRRPAPSELAALLRGLGPRMVVPPPAPPMEALPRWRRAVRSIDPRRRAAASISSHYDVSNAFYEKVLGPSMAYTCAVFDTPETSLEQAQERKFALVADKLALRPGQRLLDVGCGWGGMAMHAAREHGVSVLAVTLSREQAAWGREAVERAGLSGQVEIRHADYRDVAEGDFDAISSIGLTEHVGVRSYGSYFAFLHDRLRDGGRLLNHCITRADGRAGFRPEPFTDRYVFPDGELAAPGRVVSECHDAGFEVQHDENLRMHYALTLQHWCQNLVDAWDFCVEDAGLATARIWGLYMAGSRMAFEANWLQLHQVLATKVGADGATTYPLRPDWRP
ncbi:SAM-dependent methyltransferase [Arsenicicoccus bolidensis]|uniref:Cyclopropane-fatty-acyl-phospholipid synthase family protein n=1 Tax=Arsenicicoccus bolidensis TaxID=229480 RepID=A0ABS9PYD0_9MICO|nr:cyclopropane-fatty-acyl-phospholipid synthase family protein [Arsenicicoccus bolidensis]MCG7320620.1 cyclopropane-fatty-acyl-phospholipid synthase family protein [Arsenicicoccus bolidensis]